MSSKNITSKIQVMKALANLQRLSVLMTVAESGPTGIRTSVIAEELEAIMTVQEASKALRVLRQAGLVQNETKNPIGGCIQSWYHITNLGKKCLELIDQI